MPNRYSPEKIKRWRLGQGKTRVWLAEQCAVSPRTIEAWEQGARNPSGPALLLLERLMSSMKTDDSENA